MPGFTPGGLASTTPSTMEQRLSQAESAVRDFCRWHIAPVVVEELRVRGSGYVTHVLPTRALVSVTNVTLDGVTLIEGRNFTIDRTGILERIDGGRFVGRLTLRMTHGYDTTPPAVAGIITDMAKTGAIGGAGASKMDAGPFSVTLNASADAGSVGLTVGQKNALSRYALEPGLF